MIQGQISVINQLLNLMRYRGQRPQTLLGFTVPLEERSLLSAGLAVRWQP